MPSLSLQQTRTYIDKLGDLENELTRTCRVAEIMAKDAGKDRAAASGRLTEACDASREHLTYVAEAKKHLLEFDGFLHAQSETIRESLERPQVVSYLNEVGTRMGRAMESHVHAIASGAIEALRRVAGGVKDMRDAKVGDAGEATAKASVKALAKVCAAAEKAIRDGVKEHKAPAPKPEPVEDDVVVVEEEVEMDEGKKAHGYNLTAALPPEFLENAQKKKDEAAAKKDGDKGDDKEDEGKKAHGYNLTAALPPEFLENAQKKKDEAAAKKDGDKDEDEGKKAHGYTLAAEMPDFIKEKIEERSGDKDKDDDKDEDKDEDEGKKAHGYRLSA